jgi:tetratricopeptide (TPR) repeat protein
LQLKPGLWKLEALLGISERRAGDPAAAADLEESFTHLTEEKVRVQTGLELIELCYSIGDLNKAAGIAGTLRQISPTDPDVLYTAHRIYSDLADETTLSLVMAAPDSARMHQVMAQELARQGDSPAAIAHYREALKLEPQLPGAHFELAELLNAGGSRDNQQEVEQEYKLALKNNPFDAKSENRLGEIAFRQSDLNGALEHYSRAVKLQPRDAEANIGLGKTLLSLHQPAKALPLLETAVQLDPYNALAHYRLGVAYRESGRGDDAKRELAEFQKLKAMREKLDQVYRQMRLKPKNADAGDPDIPK